MSFTDTSRLARFVGNYELVTKIAEGGMGAVYRGRHRDSGVTVAIKIIPAEAARNPLLLRRFEQEFRAASLIDHPNVVKALDYCGTGPTPFLVMEFVEGESLGQRVERDGALPEAEAVRLVGQVCEGLHRAHKQGLIHRDVKPDNILVTPDGTAKLTDLGLVKDIEGELNLTRTGRGLGTPHFMAPEQFRNAKNADVRCDVYSLGATLYMLLTGEVPFGQTTPLDCWLRKTKNDFPPPRQLIPTLSERTNWAVLRAMGHDPAQRPASCREFMEDLTGAGWRTAQGSGAYMVPTGPPAGAGQDTLPSDLWYLVYQDEAGRTHTVKGATDSVRKNLTAGRLGDLAPILVCRTKAGQFQPLRNVPEFRDLVMSSGSARLYTPLTTPGTARSAPPLTPTATRPIKVASTAADALGTDPHPAPADGLAPALDPAPFARPADRPFDWTPWAVLGFAVAAAVLGGLFVLR